MSLSAPALIVAESSLSKVRRSAPLSADTRPPETEPEKVMVSAPLPPKTDESVTLSANVSESSSLPPLIFLASETLPSAKIESRPSPPLTTKAEADSANRMVSFPARPSIRKSFVNSVLMESAFAVAPATVIISATEEKRGLPAKGIGSSHCVSIFVPLP